MSRRNFILLIIVLVIITVSALLFFYFKRTPGQESEGGGGFFSNLNPFGSTETKPPAVETPTTPGTGEVITIGEEERQLVKVSTMPIAGFAVFQKEKTEKEFVPALRYVARTNGNVYQTFADDVLEGKLSETIIPKVYEALFGNNGEMVIMRYLKSDEQTIQTFLGALPKEKLGGEVVGERKVEGSFLPDNISDLSLSFDTTKIFYLLNTNDITSGIILNLKDNKKTQVFDSQFAEWLSFWPNIKMITLNTKPSGTIPGYMYAIDPAKKDFRRILSNINGLTTLTSPDSKLILYSDNNLNLGIYHTDTRDSSSIGLRTLAEKCIWNKTSADIYCAVPKSIQQGIYPDIWYKGEMSFFDEIWKINVENGVTTKIINPIDVIGGEEIDGIKLALDNDENYLFFVNKKDSYLWKLKLK